MINCIIYNSILDIEKENTIALNGKASIQQLLGNFIESESIYKKVLKNDPYNQKAYYGYSQCKKVDESDREYIHKLEGVIKNKENLLFPIFTLTCRPYTRIKTIYWIKLLIKIF